MTIGWWSGGVTSAVAIKIQLQYSGMQLYFCETNQHHPDNERFKNDCEKWYGQKIHTLVSRQWKSVEHVIKKERYVNGPSGASCTKHLKKEVRIALEKFVDYDTQVFGFEYEPKQVKRAERFIEQYPASNAIFPLIDHKMTKLDAMTELSNYGIELPAMYKLGYSNANCIGCVKGGMGYWNKIRQDFPSIFASTAKLEREIGHSCIKGKFLDELPLDAGRFEPIELPECGIYCEVEAMT